MAPADVPFGVDPADSGGSRGDRRGGTAGRSQSRGRALRNRLLVAVPAALYALFIIDQGGWVFALGLLGLGLIALHELYAMLFSVRPNRAAGSLVLGGLLAAALWGDGQFHVVMAVAAAFPAVFLVELLRPRGDHVTLGIAATLFGAFWLGIPFAHAVLLRDLPHGGAIMIDVLVGTFVGDTFAYAAGSIFGRHKLAPRISPNKTQEGLLAGLLGATASVWFAGLYQEWLTGTNALLIGFAVAAAAPIGDLFESLIKRDLDVKDTGRFFGEHGGVLDRLDALMFTVVAGYYAWYAMVA